MRIYRPAPRGLAARFSLSLIYVTLSLYVIIASYRAR